MTIRIPINCNREVIADMYSKLLISHPKDTTPIRICHSGI